ncbi:MAG: diguanylate cyclase [Nitrospirota bacterium]|nr:diguanylate cyclase [Nitrospirota bacterium]
MAKHKILVIEDNKTQANIVKDNLTKNGYDVLLAVDGISGFKQAKTERPDLVLLDRVLPDMDGNEVCRWMKLDPSTRDIPVIMLTARSTSSDKVAGLEAGADDYLPKPFDETELIARISVRLRSKSQQDELKKKNRQLEDMLSQVENLAVMDPLTGLFNRRRFETILGNEFRRSVRYHSPLSLLMLDIDHFKIINDTFGHQTGDAVLKECARLFHDLVRQVDTVARYGGEEFVILSPNITRDSAFQAADRIRKAIEAHSFPGVEGRSITISIGVASMPDPALDSEEKFIHSADMAMYEAKKKGRNRVVSA